MQQNDYKKFVEILNTFAEIYKRELSTFSFKLYWEVLKDLPFEVVSANAYNHHKFKKFFPLPADLRNDQNIDNKSMLAWEEVKFAIREYGYYHSVKFDDPVIHSTIDLMGGWKELYQIYFNEKKLEWVSKEFCRCYKAMSEKKVHPEYLPGFHEIENVKNAYDEYVEPPMLIFRDSKGELQSRKEEPKLLKKETVKQLKKEGLIEESK